MPASEAIPKKEALQMLVDQGVKPEEGDLALLAVPCKEDNPEECALDS